MLPKYPKNTPRNTSAPKISPQPRPYRPKNTPAAPAPRIEHIRPLNPKVSRARVEAAAKASAPSRGSKPKAKLQPNKKRSLHRVTVHDFLLGFFVGLVVFGIAAVIICSVLIGMII